MSVELGVRGVPDVSVSLRFIVPVSAPVLGVVSVLGVVVLGVVVLGGGVVGVVSVLGVVVLGVVVLGVVVLGVVVLRGGVLSVVFGVVNGVGGLLLRS